MKIMNKVNSFQSLSDLIRASFGTSVTIISEKQVFGGDINEAVICRLSDGNTIFTKRNNPSGLPMFLAEAEGLKAMKETGTIPVPETLGAGRDPAGFSFLAMEYLAAGKKTRDYHETFGRNLAAMHQADTETFVPAGRFGFTVDNYIGSTPQTNMPEEDWITFFRDRRLVPQYKMAKSYFTKEDRLAMDRLLDHLDRYLTEPEYPSLLHGDLWSGNYVSGPDGKAWLIDPATYVGHREADMAMTELFGGFSPAFYGAYNELIPRDPGYRDRKELYNLYHLLNHLNLFGGGYRSSVMGIIHRYGG